MGCDKQGGGGSGGRYLSKFIPQNKLDALLESVSLTIDKILFMFVNYP
jgi:hypothetical protein